MTTPLPWSFNGFRLDDGLPQGQASFSRGNLKNAQGIDKIQDIASVVAHSAGEMRTASRRVPHMIVHTGHVWAPFTQDEAGLIANLDTLKAALTSVPVGPLCLWPDGRYYLAELVQFDDGVTEGDVMHTEYTATWKAYDPLAYGPVTTLTVLTNATLLPASPGSTLYVYRYGGMGAVMPGLGVQGWPPPAWPGLGSAASALQVRLTLVHANGCFKVGIGNPQASPAQSAAMTAAPFSDGDVVTFDSAGSQVLYTHQGITTGSPNPAGALFLQPGQLATSGFVVTARSPVPPIVTVTLSYQARFS